MADNLKILNESPNQVGFRNALDNRLIDIPSEVLSDSWKRLNFEEKENLCPKSNLSTKKKLCYKKDKISNLCYSYDSSKNKIGNNTVGRNKLLSDNNKNRKAKKLKFTTNPYPKTPKIESFLQFY